MITREGSEPASTAVQTRHASDEGRIRGGASGSVVKGTVFCLKGLALVGFTLVFGERKTFKKDGGAARPGRCTVCVHRGMGPEGKRCGSRKQNVVDHN